jgi:hypothetical protein
MTEEKVDTMIRQEEEAATETSNLAVIPDSKYKLFRDPVEEAMETTEVNSCGAGMDIVNLPRIKIPSGGGSSFEVPTEKDPVSKAKVEGIIAFAADFRTYWSDPETAGNPPDCISGDTLTGRGTPGGTCAVCPMSEWGSGRNNKGQACSTKRKLFLIVEDAGLPIVLDAPPTSINPIKSYFNNLATFTKQYCHVVSSISLDIDKTDKGIKYSKLKIGMVRVLDAHEKALMNVFKASIKSAYKKSIVGGNR